MTSPKIDILIVGAGAAGLTLAIDLARRGVNFRLIEKNETPFGGSRGKGIQPRSQEIFADLGALDGLLAHGGLYPPVHRYEGGKIVAQNLAEKREPQPDEPYPNPLMVPQWRTEQVLRERLAALGHAPEFGAELTGFEQDSEEVRATVKSAAGDDVIRARYLVGTDGGRSFVRHALGIGFPGYTLPYRAVIGDMAIPALPRDVWYHFAASDGQLMALCPLAGTDQFQMVAGIPADAEPDLSDAGINALLAERSGRDDLRIGTPTWLSVFQMNLRLAEHYRVGRVLLAGDAAHVHPPTGGQGLNTSIQDAYNLGWKLAATLDGAPDALLESYEAERRPIAAGMLELSARLLGALKERGDMRRGRETQQLDLGYRDSPLTKELRRQPGKLQAGDRAPDAPCQTAQGEPTRLFEVFRGPHFTLLGYEIPDEAMRETGARAGLTVRRVIAPGAALPGDLVDASDHIRAAYDLAPGTWMLVRPDGYVGLMADAAEAGAIDEYLSAWTGPTRP